MLSNDRTLGGYGVDLETFATLNQTFILFNYVVMELDYDGLLEAYNLRIEECMYKGKRIAELEEENKELKAKINKVIELFNEGDSSDLYDYIDDLDYEEK